MEIILQTSVKLIPIRAGLLNYNAEKGENEFHDYRWNCVRITVLNWNSKISNLHGIL